MTVHDSLLPPPGALDRVLLAVLLAAAFVLRAWGLGSGVPHAVGAGEPQVLDRALRILSTGDWNPHLFDYPPLVVYLHAAVAIACYLWGAMNGAWYSLASFDIASAYTWGRAAAAGIGTAGVWLTYRLGREVGSTRLALVAAALLATLPSHVRESHFILTGVPACALMTATLALTARASRAATWQAYAWAGAAAGLSAAASYSAGLVFVAVVTAWLVCERTAADRWWKIGAAIVAAKLAFVLAAPYSLLDLPAFLDGFAAQLARPSSSGSSTVSLLSLQHPWFDRWLWVLAGAGLAIVLWRRGTRRRWLPPIVVAAAGVYVRAARPTMSTSYALLLAPVLCLLVAATLLELTAVARRWPPLSGRRESGLALAVLLLVLVIPSGVEAGGWLRQFARPDTRALAADWIRQQLPGGATIAVEASGPAYLDRDGFHVLTTGGVGDHPPEWYVGQAQYLVISSADAARNAGYLRLGTAVYQVAPTAERRGPSIVIVKLHP